MQYSAAPASKPPKIVQANKFFQNVFQCKKIFMLILIQQGVFLVYLHTKNVFNKAFKATQYLELFFILVYLIILCIDLILLNFKFFIITNLILSQSFKFQLEI